MLIVNKQKLEASAEKEDHPMHTYWKEYQDGLKRLKKQYPDNIIRFVRPGYPIKVDGMNAKGEETHNIDYPNAPISIPLKTNFNHPTRGKETWTCCMDEPEVLPGNLWDIKRLGKHNIIMMVESPDYYVNIKDNPELAFYMCNISSIVRGGHIKISDPVADKRALADIERRNTELNYTIFNILKDEAQLRKICQARDIPSALTKDPDELRLELRDKVLADDKKAQSDPAIHGIKDFMEELKVGDSVRLRAFIRHFLDKAKDGGILYNVDGRYKVGEKVIIQVPSRDLPNKFDYLCNFLNASNQIEKLQELLADLITKEYLDQVGDSKDDLRWLAKVMNIEGYFNKPPEQVRELVYQKFGLTL